MVVPLMSCAARIPVYTLLISMMIQMGANTFTIRNKSTNVRIGKKGTKPKRYATISFNEASDFKASFSSTSFFNKRVGVTCWYYIYKIAKTSKIRIQNSYISRSHNYSTIETNIGG